MPLIRREVIAQKRIGGQMYLDRHRRLNVITGPSVPPIVPTFDSAVTNAFGSGQNATWNHTVASDANCLILSLAVGINSGGGDGGQVIAPTYNGVAMTALTRQQSNNSNTYGFVQQFVLMNPATGTHVLDTGIAVGSGIRVSTVSTSFKNVGGYRQSNSDAQSGGTLNTSTSQSLASQCPYVIAICTGTSWPNGTPLHSPAIQDGITTGDVSSGAGDLVVGHQFATSGTDVFTWDNANDWWGSSCVELQPIVSKAYPSIRPGTLSLDTGINNDGGGSNGLSLGVMASVLAAGIQVGGIRYYYPGISSTDYARVIPFVWDAGDGSVIATGPDFRVHTTPGWMTLPFSSLVTLPYNSGIRETIVFGVFLDGLNGNSELYTDTVNAFPQIDAGFFSAGDTANGENTNPGRFNYGPTPGLQATSGTASNKTWYGMDLIRV